MKASTYVTYSWYAKCKYTYSLLYCFPGVENSSMHSTFFSIIENDGLQYEFDNQLPDTTP